MNQFLVSAYAIKKQLFQTLGHFITERFTGFRRSDLERLERGTWVFCLLFLLWKQRLLVRTHVLGGLEARPVPQSGETKDGRLLQGRHAGFWRQSLLQRLSCRTVSQDVPGDPAC